jgi:hypothetical protein
MKWMAESDPKAGVGRSNQSDPQLRYDYLEMQRRWLGLARSYEFSERLESFRPL